MLIRQREHICQRCGCTFISGSNNAKYCSRACQFPRKEKQNRICERCGQSFISLFGKICQDCHHPIRSYRLCKYCGQEFKVQSSSQYYCATCRSLKFPCTCGLCDKTISFYKYISHGKRFAHGHNPVKKETWNRVCSVCGKGMLSHRKTCSSTCKDEAARRYMIARWQAGEVTIPIPKNNRFKAQWYKGIYLRSSWEVALAITLDEQGYKWEYETKRFKLSNGIYIPDFYLPRQDFFIEIKGQWTTRFEKRMDELEQLYPEINILIVNRPPPYNWIMGDC